jgi:gamma-glutamylcyclotransferase (GGCT)/AIG2-like uncharacterized protein YtfP
MTRIAQPAYAFYGSLRRGMPLYQEFQAGLRYQFSQWLTGYDLFSLGAYPCAVKSSNPNSKILIEVMQVHHPETERKIQEIEMNAGYHVTTISIQEQPVKIYVFENASNYPIVMHGDWVTFFGS